MLKIHIGTEIFTLETDSAELNAHFSLDDDWRDRDYQKGGNALGLTFSGNYFLQESEFQKAEEQGIIISERDTFFLVSLEINHTDFDMKSETSIPLGNIPLFFSLNDLTNLSVSEEICKNSTLWVGNFPLCDITSITFKNTQKNTIECEILATSLYYDGEKEVPVSLVIQETDIPFLIEARMEGGETEPERVTSISQCKECLESIYPKEQYHYDMQDAQEEAFGIKICIL